MNEHFYFKVLSSLLKHKNYTIIITNDYHH